MRVILVSAVLLSFATLAPAALAVESGCAGWVCDAIRDVCGGPCVSLAEAGASDCSGGVCDTVNRLCGNCLPAADAAAPCASSVCTEINERVCQPYFGTDCVY